MRQPDTRMNTLQEQEATHAYIKVVSGGCIGARGGGSYYSVMSVIMF